MAGERAARGRHVDTGALVAALDSDTIAGAALDVTDPEPLPDGHPLWGRPDCIITPHTADTIEMVRPLLADRIRANVTRSRPADRWSASSTPHGLLTPGRRHTRRARWGPGD